MYPLHKNHSIYDLLDWIKNHPGLYLRCPTLGCLHDFLDGVSVGQHFGAPADGEPRFADFSAWFCHHHKAPGAAAGGWYCAIMGESSDERSAFDRFFQYLEAYRHRRLVLQYQFTLTQRQRELYRTAQASPAPHSLLLRKYKGERCLFLHAKPLGKDWYLHAAGFGSLAGARRYLAKVFGITGVQWRRAKNRVGEPSSGPNRRRA
jgi:hypothetical protein